ncbi:MAG: beta-lactamase family protein, partial [Clostridia bacterium]|nr:beta-lactamase family protein [Clostridia bacterium]
RRKNGVRDRIKLRAERCRFSEPPRGDPVKPVADAAEERKNVNSYVISDCYDSGGAGIVSSPDEYVKLISALACSGCVPGGNRILKPETVAMMQKNYLVPAAMADFVSWRLYGYGWGLCGRVHIDPEFSMSKSPVGEFGWDGAAGAFVMADPENRIGLYFATHTIGSSYAYREIHPRLRTRKTKGMIRHA